MNLEAQINKLRKLNTALVTPENYLSRVVLTRDNEPYLSIGDLVSFDKKPENNIDENKIYLFIYSNSEVIGFVKNGIVNTMANSNKDKFISAHRLLFCSK